MKTGNYVTQGEGMRRKEGRKEEENRRGSEGRKMLMSFTCDK